jgi:hypothetical protein
MADSRTPQIRRWSGRSRPGPGYQIAKKKDHNILRDAELDVWSHSHFGYESERGG